MCSPTSRPAQSRSVGRRPAGRNGVGATAASLVIRGLVLGAIAASVGALVRAGTGYAAVDHGRVSALALRGGVSH